MNRNSRIAIAVLAGAYSAFTLAAQAQGDAQRGAKAFQACAACHTLEPGRNLTGPSLANLFGHEVKLQGGGTVVADDAYLRESIMLPQTKIVDGFLPIMPTFQGLLSEEQLLQLIAYVKTLKGPAAAQPPAGPAGAPAPQQK